MTKADLIEEVSRVVEMTRKESEVIVEAIFDSIVRSLRGSDKIEIRGFVYDVVCSKRSSFRSTNGDGGVRLRARNGSPRSTSRLKPTTSSPKRGFDPPSIGATARYGRLVARWSGSNVEGMAQRSPGGPLPFRLGIATCCDSLAFAKA